MLITSVTPSELFVTTPDGPAQVLVVALESPEPDATVTVTAGGTVVGEARASDGALEVPLTGLIGRRPGERVEAEVTAGTARVDVLIPVAEPGWTVWMIPHFHYDPV